MDLADVVKDVKTLTSMAHDQKTATAVLNTTLTRLSEDVEKLNKSINDGREGKSLSTRFAVLEGKTERIDTRLMNLEETINKRSVKALTFWASVVSAIVAGVAVILAAFIK